MRQGSNNRRPRRNHHSGGQGGGGPMGPRGGGGGGGNGGDRPRSAASLRHQTFDSNCIDLRVRGNAWQVQEKYQALARDAQSSGDRVAAENYLQHAEHYYRIIEAINEATAEEQRQRGGPPPAATPFGQQPETPNNFYGAPGQQSGEGQAQQQQGNNAQGAQQQDGNQSSQAEVQRPQPQPNNFFAADDSEEQSASPQPMTGTRR